MRPPSRIFLLAVLIISPLLGLGLNYLSRRAAPHFPLTLSAAQRAATDLTVQMPSVSARVEIMSKQDFDVYKKENGIGADVSGLQTWEDGQCVVRVPSYPVVVTPRLGLARFDTQQSADNVAHELFHCAAGAWHPSWDKIAAVAALSDTPVLPWIDVLPTTDGSDRPAYVQVKLRVVSEPGLKKETAIEWDVLAIDQHCPDGAPPVAIADDTTAKFIICEAK